MFIIVRRNDDGTTEYMGIVAERKLSKALKFDDREDAERELNSHGLDPAEHRWKIEEIT